MLLCDKTILKGLALWKFVLMFVYRCMFCLCLFRDCFSFFDKRKSIYIYLLPLMTIGHKAAHTAETDCSTEMSVCGWQDVKIQLLTHQQLSLISYQPRQSLNPVWSGYAQPRQPNQPCHCLLARRQPSPVQLQPRQPSWRDSECVYQAKQNSSWFN